MMRKLLTASVFVAWPVVAMADPGAVQVPPILSAQAQASAQAGVSGQRMALAGQGVHPAVAESTAPPASIPPGVPPRVNPISPSAPLSPKERTGAAMARQWRQRYELPEPSPDGVLDFVFGAAMPSVVCAVLEPCDIGLQPGEIVHDVHAGDSVRWSITPAVSTVGGEQQTHIVVKPHDAGLVTSLIVHTSRRTYAIRLVSTRGQWMPLVAFTYPDDANAAWAGYRRTVGLRGDPGFAGTPRAHQAGMAQDAGEDIEFYRISGDHPGWRPIRAWTDGAKTFVQFPHGLQNTDAPTLVALSGGGLLSAPQQQMVFYRVQGDRYVVDQVLNKFALSSGVGGSGVRVTLRREGDN